MTTATLANLSKGSLYCHECKGDLMNGTCTCEHELCSECVGCVTCGNHEKSCSRKND